MIQQFREPAWGIPPVAKVMRKEARHMQRRDRASWVLLQILKHLPPKPESAYFTALCSHLHLWLYEGCPPPPLSERVNLQLQLIKFLGMTRVFQPTNSSEGYSSHMWLFTASQPWEARDVLNFLNTDSFEQLKDWLETVLVKGFSLVGPMFAAKFPYPLPTVSLGVYWLIQLVYRNVSSSFNVCNLGPLS